MRLVRALCIAPLLTVLVGCLHEADRPRWMSHIPLLRPTAAEDTALIEYVVVERTAGGDEINRRAWDRVDEQVLPFETRTVLETAGLRVGIAGESTPGALRKLIEDPRSDRGHRGRTFPLDKPRPLVLSDPLNRAEFTLPATDGKATPFAHDSTTLGFEITVRDGPDGKVLVRLVPRALYRDPSRLLPTSPEERNQSTETFPAAGFDVAILPAEYLVVGTDSYWQGTFGHAALTGEAEGRKVQRLLVLRARRSRPDRDGPPLWSGGDRGSAPPLATQASLARGSRP